MTIQSLTSKIKQVVKTRHDISQRKITPQKY